LPAIREKRDIAWFKKRLLSPEFLFFFLIAVIFFCVLYLTYLSRVDFFQRIRDYYVILLKSRDLWATPIPSLLERELWQWENLQKIFETSLFHLPYLLYGLTLGHVFLKWRRGSWEKSDSLLAVTALFGICAYGLIIFRAGFDALFRVLPPFYFLLGYSLSRMDTRLSASLQGFTGIGTPIKKLLVFYKAALLAFFPVAFLYDIIGNNGFYAGSIGALRGNTAHLRIARADLYVSPEDDKAIREIVGFVRDNTNPEDFIFCLPFNPIWYFLTERQNPSYHEWILPGVLRKKEEQEAVVKELRARPPSYIIYADVAIDGKEDRRFSRYAPVIEKFIRERYAVVKEVGYFKIFGPSD